MSSSHYHHESSEDRYWLSFHNLGSKIKKKTAAGDQKVDNDRLADTQKNK